MQDSTTVRLARETRDALKDLAAADGVTMDEALRRLVRGERQRRMGDALACHAPDASDDAWLRIGATTVRAE